MNVSNGSVVRVSAKEELACIPMAEVHRRLAQELARMTGVCDAVEEALSAALQHVKNLEDLPVMNFQGLDRLRQDLTDFSRLAMLLAHVSDRNERLDISVDQLRKSLLLTGNADFFCLSPWDRIRDEEAGGEDEFWD